MIRIFTLIVVLCGLLSLPAAAAQVQMSGDTQLMFSAMQKVMHRDFRGAEAIYSKVIEANPNNIEAWLQRALMRRELKDAAGARSDGHQAAAIADRELAKNPNDATLYYYRGMGLRYMKDYPDAERDIARAIQMSGSASWKADLQATELEAKEGE